MEINPKLILSWKQAYGDIYSVLISGTEYYFRALTFAEYDDLALGTESMADAEEMILDIAVLWPESVDFNKLKAGIITSLAEEIVDVSAFSDIDNARTILEVKRQEAHSFRFNMKAFVLAVRSRFIEADLDNMTFTQLAREVAMAERIMSIKQAILGIPDTGVQLEIVDPAEIEQAERESQDFSHIPDPSDIERSIDKPTTLGTAKVGDPIADRLNQTLRGG